MPFHQTPLHYYYYIIILWLQQASIRVRRGTARSSKTFFLTCMRYFASNQRYNLPFYYELVCFIAAHQQNISHAQQKKICKYSMSMQTLNQQTCTLRFLHPKFNMEQTTKHWAAVVWPQRVMTSILKEWHINRRFRSKTPVSF